MLCHSLVNMRLTGEAGSALEDVVSAQLSSCVSMSASSLTPVQPSPGCENYRAYEHERLDSYTRSTLTNMNDTTVTHTQHLNPSLMFPSTEAAFLAYACSLAPLKCPLGAKLGAIKRAVSGMPPGRGGPRLQAPVAQPPTPPQGIMAPLPPTAATH